MSHDLDTFEQVDAYQAEHGGLEPLRMMLAQGALQGQRRSVVENYLRQREAADELQKERDRASAREAQAIKSLELAERSAAASERSATATEEAAEASERSAKYAFWAAAGAVIVGLITFAQFLIDMYRSK